MPGKHKYPTISFRPNTWERAVIEQRAALSGMHKKDFITQSCMYAEITVEGHQENVQRIIDAIHDMRTEIKGIAGQIQSDNFTLRDESWREMKEDYLALAVTLVDIIDGAAYLFEKEPPSVRRKWKANLELEQMRRTLGLDVLADSASQRGGHA